MERWVSVNEALEEIISDNGDRLRRIARSRHTGAAWQRAQNVSGPRKRSVIIGLSASGTTRTAAATASSVERAVVVCGPIAVGALGFFLGLRGLHWHSLACAAVAFLIGFAIERANQAAVRRSIDLAIRSVDKQIQQLEQDNE